MITWGLESIAAGRVDIREGMVASLPFPDDTFDLVCAVETHYYWPDLRDGLLYLVVMKYVMRSTYLSLSEHSALLSSAGYSDVAMFENRGTGSMCAVARK